VLYISEYLNEIVLFKYVTESLRVVQSCCFTVIWQVSGSLWLLFVQIFGQEMIYIAYTVHLISCLHQCCCLIDLSYWNLFINLLNTLSPLLSLSCSAFGRSMISSSSIPFHGLLILIKIYLNFIFIIIFILCTLLSKDRKKDVKDLASRSL